MANSRFSRSASAAQAPVEELTAADLLVCAAAICGALAAFGLIWRKLVK